MRATFPHAEITYVPGTQFLSNRGDPVPASVLSTPQGKPGLEAAYGPGAVFNRPAPILSRVEPTVDLDASDLPAAVKGRGSLSVRWSGYLTPGKTGEYLIGMKSNGFASVTLGGEHVMMMYGPGADLGRVHLEKGQREKLVVEYGHLSGGTPRAQLIWAPVNNQPDPAALAVPWEKAHADAILEAWYAGEEGGAAIARTLSGENDPGGRLPLTFYRSVHQLPNFASYSMKGHTYCYFKGKPLWPFAYGLSYTTFRFDDLSVPRAPIDAGEPLEVSVRVTNTGKVAGSPEAVRLR